MTTPVKFKKLTIRNFMSYGNNYTDINLDFNEPILIIGKNHDAIVNGQLDSNGAGKSAILDALAFSLYDKTISNKDKTDLINNVNKKNLEVKLEFEKDGVLWRITRIRKTKTKADVLLEFKNGDDWKDKTPDSITNTNKEVERIVGIPFDVFARIIVFSATFQPFLDLPSRHASKASQTSIMEELFGYTELTDKADALKEKIKGVKAEFAHITELQQHIEKEKERHAQQLKDVGQRLADWDVEHQAKIERTNNKLEELRKIDIDSERATQEALKKLREETSALESDKRVLQSEMDSFIAQRDASIAKIAKVNKAREKIKLIEEKIDFDKQLKIIEAIAEQEKEAVEQYDLVKYYNGELVKFRKENSELEAELEVLRESKCPYCKQSMHDADEKIANLHPTYVDLGGAISEAQQKLDEATEKLATAEANTERLTNKSMFKGSMKEYNNLRDQYREHKQLVDNYEEEVDGDIDLAVESKKGDIRSIDERIRTKQQQLKIMAEKTEFDNLAAIERIVVQAETTAETLEELKKEANPHKSTLEDIKNVTFEDDHAEKLNALDVELRHQEFLLKLLTKKDSFVRKNLLDRSLPFMNKRLMVYLEKLGLPHRVAFQPDMSAKISQFGTELQFGSLSSGQRARVNLALAFAFRDVLQARHGKISFCMLDECLDTGLGNVGVQLAAKMIKEIATEEEMSMFIISHRDEISSMFKTQMVVELKNGFSNITQAA